MRDWRWSGADIQASSAWPELNVVFIKALGNCIVQIGVRSGPGTLRKSFPHLYYMNVTNHQVQEGANQLERKINCCLKNALHCTTNGGTKKKLEYYQI